MIMWIAAGALALIGVYFFFSGLGSMGKGKFGSGFLGTLMGAAIALAGGAAALLGLDMATYERLTTEQSVATVAIEQRGPQSFRAQIRYADGTSQTLDMAGDQWRMEAIVVKWKPWSNVLGQDAMYKLERFSGRYISPQQEETARRTVYDLTDRPSELEAYAGRVGNLFYAVDATYGSGVYLPMVDGAEYKVFLTQDALIARPGNAIAERAVPSMIDLGGN
jgi:hypothetical protein